MFIRYRDNLFKTKLRPKSTSDFACFVLFKPCSAVQCSDGESKVVHPSSEPCSRF